MFKTIKSSLYRLFRDKTFLITMIVGAVLAVLMNVIYLIIDNATEGIEFVQKMCTGPNMLIKSFSPVQNFGISIPINLIVYTINEFNFGTIRNKVIAGHKKSEIYTTLIITGLIFTFILLFMYVIFSTLIATCIGGFKLADPSDPYTLGITLEYIFKFVILNMCAYIFIASLSIFLATQIRMIGGTTPIVMISILFLYFYASIYATSSAVEENGINWFVAGLNPLFGIGSLENLFSNTRTTVEKEHFLVGIISPLTYSVLLWRLGALLFSKRDLK